MLLGSSRDANTLTTDQGGLPEIRVNITDLKDKYAFKRIRSETGDQLRNSDVASDDSPPNGNIASQEHLERKKVLNLSEGILSNVLGLLRSDLRSICAAIPFDPNATPEAKGIPKYDMIGPLDFLNGSSYLGNVSIRV